MYMYMHIVMYMYTFYTFEAVVGGECLCLSYFFLFLSFFFSIYYTI